MRMRRGPRGLRLNNLIKRKMQRSLIRLRILRRRSSLCWMGGWSWWCRLSFGLRLVLQFSEVYLSIWWQEPWKIRPTSTGSISLMRRLKCKTAMHYILWHCWGWERYLVGRSLGLLRIKWAIGLPCLFRCCWRSAHLLLYSCLIRMTSMTLWHLWWRLCGVLWIRGLMLL